MLNNYKKGGPVITGYFILLLTLTACDFSKGGPGRSTSIKESKDRKVFLSEYVPLANPIVINDTIQITVEEAWIEEDWGYEKNHSTVKQGGEQVRVVINTNKKSIKNYGIDLGEWFIGTDEYDTFGSQSWWSWPQDEAVLSKKLDSFPESDTISWKVKTGDRFVGEKVEGAQKVIGQFKLVRKNLKVKLLI
ncbi:hypothetical protein GXP67_12890 [Rhodocytophaga rosea]|uniref:Lipoprotein n=1 Tax=Rhodocytophaga rosea TaxID=2704465 RepID=A0A6C0GIA4_9BACT|nr:hypothetical protein [Rhodocytophaga rosea]QHT67460.1 hypothetical protein GXP67_12890 [Rhodocytophaga rosea]